MSQFDLFGDPVEEAPAVLADPMDEVRAQHQVAIDELPEKLRPQCMPVGAAPDGKAELDEWTRTSQRTFLLWMIGALARGMYTASSMTSLPGVLQKLNGLGGEW
ncbi:hypothetical protein [Paraburkholderia xenovorans]|uniref:hypothetical protein n=1 Tax=Paraburkholderia xenovorans TaxID=36873 RepID=UPI0038BB25AD